MRSVDGEPVVNPFDVEMLPPGTVKAASSGFDGIREQYLNSRCLPVGQFNGTPGSNFILGVHFSQVISEQRLLYFTNRFVINSHW